MNFWQIIVPMRISEILLLVNTESPFFGELLAELNISLKWIHLERDIYADHVHILMILNLLLESLFNSPWVKVGRKVPAVLLI